MASTANPGPNGAAPSRPRPFLHYRRRSIWISALYLPLLIIPWVITCVMMFRPVGGSSYGEHVGTDVLSDEDAQAVGRWLEAAKIMSTIATVIALPVISTLLARAAVRYSQRRREGQSLSLAQLFPLADRGWADLSALSRALDDPRTASPLLLLGTLLVLITLVQPPIQSLLIRYEPTSIATCHDVPWDSYESRRIVPLGSCRQDALVQRQAQRWYDAEPGDLEQCPQGLVIPRLINKLNDLTVWDSQPHLWAELVSGSGTYPNATGLYPYDYTSFLFLEQFGGAYWPFYASALPSGSTTGVLRYHAMRQHSTSRCENVTQASFPSTCAGSSPFTTTFVHEKMVVKVCVPGASNKAPWTRSRDRQDIAEELWVDLQYTDKAYDIPGASFTTHCTANSTRGYFELGNQYNGNIPGPLLEKWPSQEEIVADFNDATGTEVRYKLEPVPEETASPRPTTEPYIDWHVGPDLDETAPLTAADPVPGPLMTSALALFGNTSFFFIATNGTKTDPVQALKSLCRTSAAPLAMFLDMMHGYGYASECSNLYLYTLSAEFTERMLLTLVSTFLSQFFYLETAQKVLDVSMFGANEIHLTTTANTGSNLYSRPILSSNGYQIHKPVKSIPGIVVISALLFLQVAAIVRLVVYNSSFPTWTATLNGSAMAQIGTELRDVGLSPLGVSVYDRAQATRLAEADGLVGLVGGKEAETDVESETTRTPPGLGLGTSGIITRGAASVPSPKANKEQV